MLSFSKRRACQRNFTSQFGAAEDGMYYEGAKPDGHADAINGMADVAAATSALPMVAAISLGFSVSVLLDPEREQFDDNPLTSLETVALTAACALSVYTIAFSLLEFYYIHLVAGAANLEDANERPNGQALAAQLVDAIEDFNGPRARARQMMWHSLTALLLAVSCDLAKSATAWIDDPIVLGGATACLLILLASVVSLWTTVYAFRSRYRSRILGEHGYNW